MSKLVAIVDDEPDIVELITHHLEKEGFKVKGFYDGENLLSYVRKELPDIIILDLMLPGIDGIEVCRSLKYDERTSSVPIIMLTAKGSETDRVVGLELGADDYIVKPFSPRELVARIKAVLRRTTLKEEAPKITRIGDLTIDSTKFEVKVKDKRIELTPTELRILEILASHKNWVFNRDQLLNRLWGHDKIVVDRTIDVHIKKLREKLGEVGKMIKTIRGIGYKLEE
ncbi:response regulator transcription factor [candidate division WOR-3 bacterium]|nr:response regulator transcription factor [candidate division WOR-3 bacterium]